MDARLGVALAHEMRRALGPDTKVVGAPTPLTGGYSADLYAVDIDCRPFELVLRLVDDEASAVREARVQAHVAALGYPAPAVVWSGGAASAVGRPFIVMARASGRTPLDAAGVLGVPRLFREIPAVLAQLMAQLHRLPTGELCDDGVAASLDQVEPGPVRDWLERERIETRRAVIVHGDLHGANVLVDGPDVTAVLDWELATLAPPEFDVARTACILAMLPGIPRLAQRGLAPLGRRSARRFVAAYGARADLDPIALRWFDVLHAARLLAVGQGTGSVADVWRPLAPALETQIASRLRASADTP
jgi:aminoglycoside phosphotransferase (APT) family kinase protein